MFSERVGPFTGVGLPRRGWGLSLRGAGAVADPGFPRGGGANHPGGRQRTILPKFPKNCMKLKEFGPPGGTHLSQPP